MAPTIVMQYVKRVHQSSVCTKTPKLVGHSSAFAAAPDLLVHAMQIPTQGISSSPPYSVHLAGPHTLEAKALAARPLKCRAPYMRHLFRALTICAPTTYQQYTLNEDFMAHIEEASVVDGNESILPGALMLEANAVDEQDANATHENIELEGISNPATPGEHEVMRASVVSIADIGGKNQLPVITGKVITGN